MKLCIQIQTERAPELRLDTVRRTMNEIALHCPGCKSLDVIEGDDSGPYVNFLFETDKPIALWHELIRRLYDNSRPGTAARQSSIVTCEGENGWDDYLLLAHYDAAERLDSLNNS